jgi:hypothetical protein
MSKQTSSQNRPKVAAGESSNPSVARRTHTLGPHVNLQRDVSSASAHDEIDTSAVTNVLKSPGRPLDASTRAMMEPRFGYDFSRVRVHTDAQAAMSAQAVQANAYTAGPDMVFGAGQYAPHSTQGQRLMAHELSHVVQQASGPVAGAPVADGLSISQPSDPFEQSARANAMELDSANVNGRHAQAGNAPRNLRPLPAAQTSAGDAHLQRDTAETANTISGVSAGIAGAGLLAGIVGTVFSGQSAAAAGRQADAAEAASVGAATSGGLVINHDVVPPGTAAGAAPAAAGAGAAAATETELPTIPLMRIGIGDAINDFAVIGVTLRASGNTITGGQTETIDSNGYVGGLAGNNLFMTLHARPTPPVGGKDVTRIVYEGNNNPARHGSTSRIQRFNGVIRVDATGAVLGNPVLDAHAHGGDPVQANPSGQPPVPVRITTPPETR